MPAGITPERFDEKYIEACFYAWYQAGRPTLQTRDGKVSASGSRVARVMPVTEEGRRPDIHTINRWMDKYAWIERADALDAQVSVKMDRDVIQKRIADLKRLSSAGEKILQKALDYFEKEENPFKDNPSAAVRAAALGQEAIFKYSGAADRLSSVAGMTDKQLDVLASHLLGKESDDENENENIIDSESEDIPIEDEQFQDNNE